MTHFSKVFVMEVVSMAFGHRLEALPAVPRVGDA
jgi:hypothetical protein